MRVLHISKNIQIALTCDIRDGTETNFTKQQVVIPQIIGSLLFQSCYVAASFEKIRLGFLYVLFLYKYVYTKWFKTFFLYKDKWQGGSLTNIQDLSFFTAIVKRIPWSNGETLRSRKNSLNPPCKDNILTVVNFSKHVGNVIFSLLSNFKSTVKTWFTCQCLFITFLGKPIGLLLMIINY